jgi:hypothetical protein
LPLFRDVDARSSSPNARLYAALWLRKHELSAVHRDRVHRRPPASMSPEQARGEHVDVASIRREGGVGARTGIQRKAQEKEEERNK